MSSWYFAYGSNMNPARVIARGLPVEQPRGGVLQHVRLAFNKQSRDHAGSGHANLMFDRHGCVEGVLYRLRNAGAIAQMDRFERTPINYSRDIVQVVAGRDMVSAWTYFANPAVIRADLCPERAYLQHLLAGRRFLSEPYYAWLCGTVCADD
jgi:cation transport regulator ChaC